MLSLLLYCENYPTSSGKTAMSNFLNFVFNSPFGVQPQTHENTQTLKNGTSTHSHIDGLSEHLRFLIVQNMLLLHVFVVVLNSVSFSKFDRHIMIGRMAYRVTQIE